MRRNGVEGFPGFRGMWLNGDAASTPIDRLRRAENVRFVGGNLRPRPGVEAFNSVAIHATDARILSLVDFQVSPLKIYMSLDGCPGISTTVGASVNTYDSEVGTPFGPGTYYTAATNNPVFGLFDGRVFIGVDSVLKAFTLIGGDYDDNALELAGFEQAEVIWTFSGYVITFLETFDGKLFIGLDDGAGAGKIAVWDGLSMFTDDGTGVIATPTAATPWREKLVVGFETAGLLVRSVGDSPGTWVAVVAAALPAVDIVSYRDAVYWVGGATKLNKWDGTTVSTPKTIAGAEIVSVAAEFGYLFYGYKSSGNAAIIGRLDSAGTFADTHKTLSEVATARYPRTMRKYRGSLAVGLNTSATGARLLISPGTNTAGTYVVTNPSAGDISNMLVA